MGKTLHGVGRDGLHQFMVVMAEIVSENMTLTLEEEASAPIELSKAETMLLATWDEICGRTHQGGKDSVKEC